MRVCVADHGTVTIRSEKLTARIAPLGAELVSLTDADGRELMSSGDPAYWTGRAPLLFPIVGRVRDDRYRVGGQEYALPQHGFARRMEFALVEHGPANALFRLVDTPETRANYPFAFQLDMAFALDGAELAMMATITNPGDVPLPASFGYHPAFAWPLPYGAARADHRITFERDEPAAICAITDDALIAAERLPSPVVGRDLPLHDALFEKDALVWDDLASRRLRYGASTGKALDISFPDTPWLGIWTKPGAPFVCVEPWAGMADPAGFSGELMDKPDIFTLAPGTGRSFRMNVALVED